MSDCLNDPANHLGIACCQYIQYQFQALGGMCVFVCLSVYDSWCFVDVLWFWALANLNKNHWIWFNLQLVGSFSLRPGRLAIGVQARNSDAFCWLHGLADIRFCVLRFREAIPPRKKTKKGAQWRGKICREKGWIQKLWKRKTSTARLADPLQKTANQLHFSARIVGHIQLHVPLRVDFSKVFWYLCLAIQSMKSPSEESKKAPKPREFSQRPMQLQRRRCCRHISLLQLQPPPLQLFHGFNRGVTMNLIFKSIHRTIIDQLVTYEKWQASTRKPECPQRRLPHLSWTNIGGYVMICQKKTGFNFSSFTMKNYVFVLKTKAFGSTCRPGGRSYGQTSPPLAPLPATGGVFVDSKKWKPSLWVGNH